VSCVTLNTVTNKEYSTEINVDKSKDSLFVECNLWVINNFNSAKSVIQYSDKEYGVIAGKYIVTSSEYTQLQAIFTIYMNNNHAKLIIKPYGDTYYSDYNLYNRIYNMLKSFNNYFNNPDPKFDMEKPKTNMGNNTYRFNNNPRNFNRY
jgi:hypothetical protein